MSTYSDGDFSLAAASSGKQKSFPFEGDTVSFVTTQNFIQLAANFEPLPLNSPDPEDPTAFLIGESERRDIGGELVEWTRTYARVPVSRNEFETYAYTFPGFVATYNSEYHSPWADAGVSILPYFPITPAPTLTDPGRAPTVRTVTSRLAYDYFLCGAGGQYEKPQDIPLNASQRYVYGSSFGTAAGGDLPDRILWDIATYCTPTTTEYRALITNETEIVAEDSRLSRWKGNIYQRVTRYVKAQ